MPTEPLELVAAREAANSLGKLFGQLQTFGRGAYSNEEWEVLNSRMYAPVKAEKLLRLLLEVPEGD